MAATVLCLRPLYNGMLKKKKMLDWPAWWMSNGFQCMADAQWQHGSKVCAGAVFRIYGLGLEDF